METDSTGQPGEGEDVGMGEDAVHIEPTLCTIITELHLLLVLGHYNRHVVWVQYTQTRCLGKCTN